MTTPRIWNLEQEDPATAIQACATSLSAGHLVIIPTDTVYGIAALPGSAKAEADLYRVKQRPLDKPLQLLVSDPDAVAAHGCRLTNAERALVEAFWPGPLTLVVTTRNGHTEGFRMPNHEIALAVIQKAGGTIRASSANQSGEPDALTAAAAVAILGNVVSDALDAGRSPGGIPSTVAKVTTNAAGDAQVEVLRTGALSAEQLQDVIRRELGG